MMLRNLSVVVMVFSTWLEAGSISTAIPAQDARNTTILDGNTHHQMPMFTSKDSWLVRAAAIRKQILSAAGLLPMPAKTPLHPKVFGKIEKDGYSVEKVLLETYPGFYLGGNLYRPLGKKAPFPGVISPHGHWDYGRLENTALASVPGRCINLARQGFVVFTYDMVGYDDTDQIPHGDKGPRMGGPREDLWSISTMGLQLWDSTRALDFIASLPDVDPEKLSVTGASGGGTQAFQLTAVDDRIKVAAPVNMLSFIHQGGGCQEAANLRVDTNNVMFGAMTAPRPLLMVSATGDWTRNTPKEEYPAIRNVFRLMDAESNLEQTQIDSPHNYNQASREAVYTFLNHRVLQVDGPVKEKPFRVEMLQDLLAMFGQARPANAIDMTQYVERKIRDARAENSGLRPKDAASLAASRKAFETQLTYSMLAELPSPGSVLAEKMAGPATGDTDAEKLVLGRKDKGDRVPAVWIAGKRANAGIAPVLIVSPEGSAAVVASMKKYGGLVKQVLDGGGAVLTIDAFQTGAAKAARDMSAKDFTVYNRTNDANRVQDILTAIAYLRDRTKSKRVTVIGLGEAGVWSYFARALAGPGVDLAADLNRFPVDSDEAFLQRFNIPGIRKAGDFFAAAVMDTQGRLIISNADAAFPAEWVKESVVMGGVRAEVNRGAVADARLASWALEGR